jgi:hypothetical protein
MMNYIGKFEARNSNDESNSKFEWLKTSPCRKASRWILVASSRFHREAPEQEADLAQISGDGIGH